MWRASSACSQRSFLVRAFVDTPGLSLTFLAVFPIVLAGFWLGRVRNCLPLGIEPTLDGEATTAQLAPGGGVLLYCLVAVR